MNRDTARLRRGYSLGGIATGTFGTVPGLLLMPYLTEVVGIGVLVAGLVVFIPKAWDMVLNPVAGRVSDRLDRVDRRRPFLLVAGPLMGLGFALMFSGPTSHPAVATAWVLAVFLVCATAYAFFQVPYLAMSAEITSDYDERTALMTWRVIVVTITIVFAGTTAPWLVSLAGGADGYRLMAWILGGVIALGALAAWWTTRNAPTTRHEEAGGRWADQMRLVIGHRHARPLVVSFVLQAVATSMLLAGVAYAARILFGDPEVASWLFLAFVGPAVLAAPLWGWLGRRLGKRRGYLLASTVTAIGLVANLSGIGGRLAPALVAGAIVGVGYTGIQLFPLAMLPDIAAHDALVHGRNRIGVFAGVWAGLELLGFALGPALLGLVLALGGYQSAGGFQPDSVTWAIAIGIAAVPAALVVLSIVAISRYRLDDELGATMRPSSSSTRP